RRVFGKAGPAAAQIEHGHARLETDLAADELEFRFLRVVERLRAPAVVRAGVEHAPVEHALVEIVADVVMPPHRFRRARTRLAIEEKRLRDLGRVLESEDDL